MACKLYVRYAGTDKYIGQYKDRQIAMRAFWAVSETIKKEIGCTPEPVYVETGKGRGK